MSVTPLLTAALLAAAPPAPNPVTLDSHEVRPPAAQGGSLPRLGVMITGGVPDGGVFSLVYRPVRWVRVDGGVAWNALSLGGQGGVTLVPFHWAVVPTLRLEGGRYFRSDVSGRVSRWAGDVPTYLQPALQGFGYDFASAQLGLELGSQRRFLFFLRGGVAWVRGEFGDAKDLRDDSSPNTEVDVTGLRITAVGPTASLGFLFYVW